MTPSPEPVTTTPALARNPIASRAWLLLGLACMALGFIGAFVPLMPTTVFLIMAAGCFARSSPRLEAWLLDHPRFGPALRAWRRDRAIPPTAKLMACFGMAAGLAIFWWGAHPKWPLLLVVAGAIGLCAAYVVSRPSRGAQG